MDPNNPDPLTLDEGMHCPNCGDGTMQVKLNGECTCHLSAPCSAHETAFLACDKCEWRQGEPITKPPARSALALEEIKAILKKHDVAGVVLVADERECNFRYELAPSWSCVWIENRPGGEMLRVKCKRADFPNQEAQTKVLGESIGMLQGFYDILNSTLGNLGGVIVMISKHVDFSHFTRRN